MDELCEITSSKRIFAADYVSEGVPFYRGKEITEKYKGNLDVSTELFISEEKFIDIERKFGAPKLGDLLLTSVGTLGSLYVVKPGDRFYFKDGNLTWFRSFKELDSQFLYYWLAAPQGKAELQKCTIGSSQSAFTIVLLKGMEIELPPLPVQRRIAGILSDYDELIENSQRRIRLLEDMARALYREWFVHFRFPGHESVPRTPSALGDIPQGWEVTTVDDVCDRVTDGSHSSPKSVESGMPMASSKDMHHWGLTLTTCRHISVEDYHDLVRNDCKPKKGDVLITKDGANYLKHIFVQREEQDLVLLSSVAMLRPNKRINPHLLAAILKDPDNKDRLKNYVTGAAIPRVILKDFKRFQFVLPSATAQAAWAKHAEPITEMIWRLIDQIQNLRRTRDLLLPRLLSGQVALDSSINSTHDAA
jgi:type I restriction enzyme S subunit